MQLETESNHLLFAATEYNFPAHAPDVEVSGKRNPVPRVEHLSAERLCCTGLSYSHDSSRRVLEEWKCRHIAHIESGYIFSHRSLDFGAGCCTLRESEWQRGKLRKGKLSLYCQHSLSVPLAKLAPFFWPLNYFFISGKTVCLFDFFPFKESFWRRITEN